MNPSVMETRFQTWLKDIQKNFMYVLSSAECAARYAFEAGFNEGQKSKTIPKQRSSVIVNKPTVDDIANKCSFSPLATPRYIIEQTINFVWKEAGQK